jgi:hypothetical protein
MKFTAGFSPEQKIVFETHAKRVAASITIRNQAAAAVAKRFAAAAVAAERRRRDEAASQEVRISRLSDPPITRADLLPHLRGR